jgi:hypothetical protein
LVRGGELDKALAVEKAVHNPSAKADVLGELVAALAKAGLEQALIAWRTELAIARFAGLETVVQAFATGISLIATVDEGQTLREIYGAIAEIGGCWDGN